ncbi:phage tail sheath family protein [Methanosarcina sp. KYL-1]|uniref:phage tail sheath family protein n=1 Tax=Methanosarcina sp. KYL-1 TaxID=2602068 RepID=UPI0021011392|nr:phage tail sheath C-terminal domain-containing protein [Methanosarcina sp. KYL-1]MCQ1536139.1 phage tail sheath family protein [Methanosarcina sp. KYL-1]
MPFTIRQPGVYVEEISARARPITGVSTSTAAFVGRARKGPADEPLLIHSFGDFEEIFGGLWEKSTMSFAVWQYFLNGGNEAVIVRVKGTGTAEISYPGKGEPESDISESNSEFESDSSENDGGDLRDEDLVPPGPDIRKGIYTLEKTDIFNLLCLPPLSFGKDIDPETFARAAAYCEKRRAMLIIDPPAEAGDPESIKDYLEDKLQPAIPASSKKNAALFFPRIKLANPLKNNLVEEFAPCGAVAGVFARTDMQRGVWKAPSGLDAKLAGVIQFSYTLNDAEYADLNRLGINCLRIFPARGCVIWGARTLEGAGAPSSEWKYIPVRRFALFIEESVFRGTEWAVFELNNETLWAQLRLNTDSFMYELFSKGAFPGTKPDDSYFIKCDRETTTQADIDSGTVNILVGFAPVKPAEFVILRIRQAAGENQTRAAEPGKVTAPERVAVPDKGIVPEKLNIPGKDTGRLTLKSFKLK